MIYLKTSQPIANQHVYMLELFVLESIKMVL